MKRNMRRKHCWSTRVQAAKHGGTVNGSLWIVLAGLHLRVCVFYRASLAFSSSLALEYTMGIKRFQFLYFSVVRTNVIQEILIVTSG